MNDQKTDLTFTNIKLVLLLNYDISRDAQKLLLRSA